MDRRRGREVVRRRATHRLVFEAADAVLREVIRVRKKDKQERDEQETLLRRSRRPNRPPRRPPDQATGSDGDAGTNFLLVFAAGGDEAWISPFRQVEDHDRRAIVAAC